VSSKQFDSNSGIYYLIELKLETERIMNSNNKCTINTENNSNAQCSMLHTPMESCDEIQQQSNTIEIKDSSLDTSLKSSQNNYNKPEENDEEVEKDQVNKHKMKRTIDDNKQKDSNLFHNQETPTTSSSQLKYQKYLQLNKNNNNNDETSDSLNIDHLGQNYLHRFNAIRRHTFTVTNDDNTNTIINNAKNNNNTTLIKTSNEDLLSSNVTADELLNMYQQQQHLIKTNNLLTEQQLTDFFNYIIQSKETAQPATVNEEESSLISITGTEEDGSNTINNQLRTSPKIHNHQYPNYQRYNNRTGITNHQNSRRNNLILKYPRNNNNNNNNNTKEPQTSNQLLKASNYLIPPTSVYDNNRRRSDGGSNIMPFNQLYLFKKDLSNKGFNDNFLKNLNLKPMINDINDSNNTTMDTSLNPSPTFPLSPLNNSNGTSTTSSIAGCVSSDEEESPSLSNNIKQKKNFNYKTSSTSTSTVNRLNNRRTSKTFLQQQRHGPYVDPKMLLNTLQPNLTNFINYHLLKHETKKRLSDQMPMNAGGSTSIENFKNLNRISTPHTQFDLIQANRYSF
jgi:hypothetical protein